VLFTLIWFPGNNPAANGLFDDLSGLSSIALLNLFSMSGGGFIG
jgi:hypothetical protein